MNNEQWQVLDLIPYADAALNVVAAIKVLALPGKQPRYQIHLGRFNRERVFSSGLPVVPGENLARAVADVTGRAALRVEELRRVGKCLDGR